MNDYINIFIDKEYPTFLDKYLSTKTLTRLKNVTQFCGCDYTKLYSPRFKYTRYIHSLVVAHMTWHFTHNKKETIIALFHDAVTPCFAHSIDYVFGDYINQESSEKNIVDIINNDTELKELLKSDNMTLNDFKNFDNYHILENKSPKLCTDRLDGVLHTCYVWLHTHEKEQIKEVYDDIIVLTNEGNLPEIGFKSKNSANKFVEMVFNYAKELQGNTDKFVMKYICEIVKEAVNKKLISYDDLYTKKEDELCEIFSTNFPSWKYFVNATAVVKTEYLPKNQFYISFDTKRRNTIPLVKTNKGTKRINEISDDSSDLYRKLEQYKDSTYAYIEEIKSL